MKIKRTAWLALAVLVLAALMFLNSEHKHSSGPSFEKEQNKAFQGAKGQVVNIDKKVSPPSAPEPIQTKLKKSEDLYKKTKILISPQEWLSILKREERNYSGAEGHSEFLKTYKEVLAVDLDHGGKRGIEIKMENPLEGVVSVVILGVEGDTQIDKFTVNNSYVKRIQKGDTLFKNDWIKIDGFEKLDSISIRAQGKGSGNKFKVYFQTVER